MELDYREESWRVMTTPIISGGWVNFELAVTPDGRQLAFGSGSPLTWGAETSYGPTTPATLKVPVVAQINGAFDEAWQAWPPGPEPGPAATVTRSGGAR
jgi:hypothetical protein